MPESRSAAAVGKDFPYTQKTVCYIEVVNDGSVTFNSNGAYGRAVAGESRLFAVWPGQYRSDLFAIDDLDEYAKAFGIVHDRERTGLADHEHQVRWDRDPREQKPNGTYIGIKVSLDCGCEIHDLGTFAAHMRQQKGWDIATSGGWGSSTQVGHAPRYSLRVRRKSLDS
jgi:hypothetical protein